MKNIKYVTKTLLIVILIGIIFMGFWTTRITDETSEEKNLSRKLLEINSKIDTLEMKIRHPYYKAHSKQIEDMKAYRDALQERLHSLIKS